MTLTGQHLFETPLIVADLQDGPAITGELYRVAEGRRAEMPGDPAQVWSSDHRMLRWAGEPAMALLNSCVELADRMTIDVEAPPGETAFGWWADLRSQFAGAENRIGPACYPSAFWSVLTVSPGDGEVRMKLHDPRMPMLQMEDPGLRVRAGPDGPILGADHEIALTPGRLLMIPAWLSRTVEFSPESQDRVLLTLNLTAFLAGAEPTD